MGRARKGGAGPRQADMYGPGYGRFSARLWGTPRPEGFRGLPCYHCGHAIRPGLGEVQHLLSPRVRPDLAQSRANVVPAHAGGRKRCPVCDLACQAIAAGNLAPRDAQGRPLPWDEAFIRARMAERAAYRARAAPSAPGGAAPRAPAGRDRAQVYRDAGRPW
jgi:hypothetical protein